MKLKNVKKRMNANNNAREKNVKKKRMKRNVYNAQCDYYYYYYYYYIVHFVLDMP